MKRILLALFLLPGLAFGSYTNYLPATVDHTKVPNTDQTDFPVLVLKTDNALKTIGNGGHVADANGYDVRAYSKRASSHSLSVSSTGRGSCSLKIS